MFLREKPETVRFMIFVTDPRNECTRKIPKVTRDDTEAIPLSYMTRAPIEVVPRRGWAKHLVSRQTRPPVLPTAQRQKKPLVVEVVDAARKFLWNVKQQQPPLEQTLRQVVTMRHHETLSKCPVRRNRGPETVQQRTEEQAVEEPGAMSREPVVEAPRVDVATVEQHRRAKLSKCLLSKVPQYHNLPRLLDWTETHQT